MDLDLEAEMACLDRDDNASGRLGWANLPLVQTYEPSYHAFDSREIMKDRGMLYQGAECLFILPP